MAIRKSIERIWRKQKSGLVVPEGVVSDFSHSSSHSYLRIKEKAIAVEKLYADSNVPLAHTSDLFRLIADAKLLSDSWLMGSAKDHPMTLLFRAGLLDRIADPLLLLHDVPNRAHFLSVVASGDLNLLDRKKSRAKDILWELELWEILKGRSCNAALVEPPDIVVKLAESTIGIACKKLYSQKHVQNVLSEAVAQIETSFDFGIIAINIDDLIPPNKILRTPTREDMSKFLSNLNAKFLHAHERHFRKYLASGRVISALVSTAVLADVHQTTPRFNHARQSTIWTIPGLAPEKARQLRSFYNQFMV